MSFPVQFELSIGGVKRYLYLGATLLLIPLGTTLARSPFDNAPPPVQGTRKRSPFDSPNPPPLPTTSPRQQPRVPFLSPVPQPPPKDLNKPNTQFNQNPVKSTPFPPAPKYLPQSYQKWFPDIQRRPVELGNDISILVGIPEIKKEMMNALLTVTGPNHYVYMANWKVEAEIQMLGLGATTTLMDLLSAASAKGAHVRALLYAPMSKIDGQKENVSFGGVGNYWANKEFAGKIETLKNGAAFLDDKRLMWGSHHQKLLIVRGNEGLIAFCGSYDPERTREGGNKDYSDMWHEVTLRVKGPAAYRLLQVFLERWTDATVPRETRGNTDFRTEIGRSAQQERFKLNGGIPAQVTVTTGDLKDNKTARWDPLTGTDTKQPYEFAPSGEMSFRAALAHAIKMAKSDIYLECQFGWGESGAMGETLRTTLTNALGRGVRVTVVTPTQDTVPELGMGNVLVAGGAISYGSQKKGLLGGIFGAVLAGGVETGLHTFDFKRAQDWFWWEPAKNKENLRIYHTDADKDTDLTKGWKRPKNHFIHSKLWIFDREFALIGSGNFNNRSLSHDSEVMTGFYDPVHLAPLRDRLEKQHIPPSLQVPRSKGEATEDNKDTKEYEVPKVLYDNFKGFGDALSDATFTKTVDPYGGPKKRSQIVDPTAPWVSQLNEEIEAAMAADLGGTN